jgi:hypothetical protein
MVVSTYAGAGSDQRSAVRGAKSFDTQSQCSGFEGTPEEGRDDMTESITDSVATISATSSQDDNYAINLSVTGKFTLDGSEIENIHDTDDETTETVGVGVSQSTVTSTSGVTATSHNVYNFTLSLSGDLTVQSSGNTENIHETEHEVIETTTGNVPPPTPTPTPTPPAPTPTPTPTPPPPTPTPTPPTPTPTP